jgi:iron complex outermembrane receptor protein
MRRTTRLALTTASSFAVALAGFSSSAHAQAQGEVTAGEATQCAELPVEQRAACVQAQAGPEGSPDEAGEAATLPPGEQAEQRAESDTIVVTGSRIRRSEFNSPDPIQIINPELGSQEGKFETVDLINSAPIAAGSVQITSAISTNFVTNGGEGAQTVSLRGLGAERTLVLLNGRRAGPAGIRGAVASFDLNTVPSSIVSSIEILKTGASSVYGSDAIAGVVNILTKKETNGLELRGFTSVPVKGGAETYSVSATYGKDFGRGHFIVSADYFRRNDLQRRDRSYLDCSEEFLTFETGERADIRDIRTGEPACSGVLNNAFITSNDFTSFFGLPGLVAPNGQPLFVTQYQVNNELEQAGCIRLNSIPGIGAPDNAFGCNFSGPTTGVLNQYSERQRRTDINSELDRRTLYAAGAFELTPGIELYTELLYNNRKTHTDGLLQLSSVQFTGSPTPGAPGLPAFFCDPAVDFNCQTTDIGDPFNNEFSGQFLLFPLVEYEADSGTDIDYYRGVFGARGEFGGFASGFSWDVHGQYSRSNGDYFQDVALSDSVNTASFRTRSCVGLVTPVTGKPCIDLDFTDPRFLRGDFTQAERDFLFTRDRGTTKFTQKSGEAVVSGNLFDLPAGPLGIALGVHIRGDEIKDVPGEASQASNSFGLTSAGITEGTTLTREVFGEIEVPLVTNTPLIDRLTLSAAGRVTRVKAERGDDEGDKFGDETWKIGADWKVNDWVRFRGSVGTSFRAPALFELFLENQTGFQQVQTFDLCINAANRLLQGQINQRIFDNCVSITGNPNFPGATGGVTILSGGGLGVLEPETSLAKTASIILTPRFNFLPNTRVSLAVDYFDIEVEDEISQLGAGAIITGCLNSEDFPNDPLCALITRIPAGQVNEFNLDTIADSYVNINAQRNRGIDVTGRVVHDFGGFGTLSLLAQMTWQLEDVLTLFASGSTTDLNGEVGDPKWVGDFNLSWNKGPWTVLYGLDVIGAANDFQDLIDTQGSPCRTSFFRPGPNFTIEQMNTIIPVAQRTPFCPDVSVSAVAYHSLSVTRDVGKDFQITLGMANILDKKPPRVSTVFSGISTLGQVPVFGSQYDYLGRRVFLNVRGNF